MTCIRVNVCNVRVYYFSLPTKTGCDGKKDLIFYKRSTYSIPFPQPPIPRSTVKLRLCDAK